MRSCALAKDSSLIVNHHPHPFNIIFWVFIRLNLSRDEKVSFEDLFSLETSLIMPEFECSRFNDMVSINCKDKLTDRHTTEKIKIPFSFSIGGSDW